MNWLALVGALISIVETVVRYCKDQQLIQGATAEAIALHLKGASDEVQQATAIRDAVRRGFDADSLPSDDPNRRD